MRRIGFALLIGAAVALSGCSQSQGGKASSAAGQKSAGATAAKEAAARKEDDDFQSAAQSLRQAMQDMPELAELSKQVLVDQTPEGLRIQLVDQEGRPMFQPGSNQLMPYARKLLASVGGIDSQLPNRVSISGHTAGIASNENHGGSAQGLSRPTDKGHTQPSDDAPTR